MQSSSKRMKTRRKEKDEENNANEKENVGHQVAGH